MYQIDRAASTFSVGPGVAVAEVDNLMGLYEIIEKKTTIGTFHPRRRQI
jgi:hypothetical protein